MTRQMLFAIVAGSIWDTVMRSKKSLPSTIHSLCVMRLSAIGDVCLALPSILALQKARPDLKITWVIGKTEYALVSHLANIEFIIFDKSNTLSSYRHLRQKIGKRRFDVLLHMQLALRSSLATLLIRARVKIGFSRAQAKEGQWLFCNRRIEAHQNAHIATAFQAFVQMVEPNVQLSNWQMPIRSDAKTYAESIIQNRDTIIVCPMASADFKTWPAKSYRAVISSISETYGCHIILCGGPSPKEQQFANEIASTLNIPLTNLVGKTNLSQLHALISQASMVIAPDTGPAHIASLSGTPIISLFACSNPLQTGPTQQAYLINHYPEALEHAFSKTIDELPWGKRIKDRTHMERIHVKEVCDMVGRVYLEHRKKDANHHEAHATTHPKMGT